MAEEQFWAYFIRRTWNTYGSFVEALPELKAVSFFAVIVHYYILKQYLNAFFFRTFCIHSEEYVLVN